MSSLSKTFNSTVSRKLIMGITGLSLILFVIVHLLGNLSLYMPEGSYFNAYAEKLHSLGPLLLIAEIGLLVLFLVHSIFAVRIKTQNYSARGPKRYAMVRSKGAPSRSNVASRNMIITGLVLFSFLILHIWQFRFGAGIPEGYTTQLDGKTVRDLYRLVFETFQSPLNVGVYVSVMIFLGLHIRHGLWSAFQSLGAMTPQLSKPIYAMGLILGVALSAGFLMIPIWIYFGGK